MYNTKPGPSEYVNVIDIVTKLM